MQEEENELAGETLEEALEGSDTKPEEVVEEAPEVEDDPVAGADEVESEEEGEAVAA